MDRTNETPVLLSGIQPSGNLMIGNYFGAIRNWIELQHRYKCFFVLVDLHAITVPQDPGQLRDRCYDFLALYLACGIDPERNTIFVQSHVPGHAQLAWVLSCLTHMGELERMTQFKQKAKRYEEGISVGLFTYPVLMAADILLFNTDLVPVGEDQKQHLELARDLAVRVNRRHGDLFKVPEAFVPVVGARIMSLQEPTAKMSKSDTNPDNYIALLDAPDAVRRKIQRAVTDCERTIACDERRPGITNLITIYSCVSGEPVASIEQRFAGKGYGEFKRELAEAVTVFLRPIQEEYRVVRSERSHLETVLKRGAESARRQASVMLARVHDALGFVPAG